MSSPVGTLNLEAWGNVLPQERNNDYEFNLLLYKFKSFYNEVRDYYRLHSQCSITKSTTNQGTIHSDQVNQGAQATANSQVSITNPTPTTTTTTTSHNNDRKSINSSPRAITTNKDEQAAFGLPNTNGQYVINLKKKLFQNTSSPPTNRDHLLLKQNTIHDIQHSRPTHNSFQRQHHQQHHQPLKQQVIGDTVPHYVSSQNLPSISSSETAATNSSNINNDVARRRNLFMSNARLKMSKSSERLDSINNNNLQFTASLEERDLDTLYSKNININSNCLPRDSKYFQNDDNIYDAVSPDDMKPTTAIEQEEGDEDDDDDDDDDKAVATKSVGSLLNCPSPLQKRNSSDFFGSYPTNTSQSNRNGFVSATSTFDYTAISKSSNNNNKTSFLNESNDRTTTDQHGNSSFNSSSIILDTSNNTSSSLSIINPEHSRNHHDQSQDYGNYVNIDYFLKRSQSPSFDGLEEDSSEVSDNDDGDEDHEEEGEETTQMSHSQSSDQLSSDLRNLSPRDLARKLSSTHIESRRLKNNATRHDTSSTSITPASSGDFLDDSRYSSNNMPPMHHHHHANLDGSISSSSIRNSSNFETNGGRYSSFSPQIKRDDPSNSSNLYIKTKSSTTPRDLSNSSAKQQQLEMIHEDSHYHHQNHHQHHSPQQQQAATSNLTDQRQQALSSGSSQLYNSSDNSSGALAEAHTTMRSFLSDLNLSPADDVFEDKAQRRIVKESFAVELCGRRKLRHLFLFNDVIVCAKYQASSKQKFTFDVKWYLNLAGVNVSDSTVGTSSNSSAANASTNSTTDKSSQQREAIDNEILAIRTNLMLLRSRMQQIKRSKDKKPSKIIKKLKKKRTQLEADLVLLLPHLPLIIKHVNGKKYTFYLSSNFDRNQWIESIKFLQSQLPATKSSHSSSTPSSSELQAWIQTCRKNLNPSLGTFLLRSNCDDDLLYGDLYVQTQSICGVPKFGHYYFCFEVDSYGHFSQKASSSIIKVDRENQDLNEEYVFPLDGAHTLRVLLYEDLGNDTKPSVIGKSLVELSRSWFLVKPVDRSIEFSQSCRLNTRLSFSNSELLSMRVPHAKLCPAFGLDITQVCKKEKTNVPLLVQLCVNEVERRGMREVGIYRMSGTSKDIQRLKKAFETDPYVAEVLLRDIDINSVTGFLKQYLREMPEGLFINKLYPKFVGAFNIPQSESLERARLMLELFHKIPIANQHTIIYLVEHLVRVNQYESYNKMSLTNLATVLGPNILRPPTETTNATNSDPFTAVVIGSMSQAGILYFFLNRKATNLPLLELDTSEMQAVAAAAAAAASSSSSSSAALSAQATNP